MSWVWYYYVAYTKLWVKFVYKLKSIDVIYYIGVISMNITLFEIMLVSYDWANWFQIQIYMLLGDSEAYHRIYKNNKYQLWSKKSNKIGPKHKAWKKEEGTTTNLDEKSLNNKLKWPYWTYTYYISLQYHVTKLLVIVSILFISFLLAMFNTL